MPTDFAAAIAIKATTSTRIIAALESLTIHRSIDPGLLTRQQVQTLVDRLAPDAL